MGRAAGGAENSQKRKERIKMSWSFPGGSVVKNPLANAEDTGLIPDA